VSDVLQLVNSAYKNVNQEHTFVRSEYKPEQGSGIRYRSADMCLKDIPHTWIGVDAESGKTICSIVCLVNDDTTNIKGPFAVDPTLQGKGYGSKMLDFVEGFSAKQTLTVWDCQHGLVKMYQKRGYQVVSSIPIEEAVKRWQYKPTLIRTDIQVMTMEKTRASI